MTRAHFDLQIARLGVLKGCPDDGEEFFPALSDVPDDLFTAAVDRALKTRTWFPVPAELRLDCDAVRVRSSVETVPHVVAELGEGLWVEIYNPFGGAPLRLLVTRDWKHDCDNCADTGWAMRWCAARLPHQSISICGRRFEHAEHFYAERCACLEWNPTIRRRKEALMKYAHAPERAA